VASDLAISGGRVWLCWLLALSIDVLPAQMTELARTEVCW
jgi:hypothetical protein